MTITSNFAVFDLELYTDAAFSEVLEVKYKNVQGLWVSVDMIGRTFLMQLRKNAEDVAAAVAITVRVYPAVSTHIEIYGTATTLLGVAAGSYLFTIMDVTGGSSAKFIVASGNCLILKNPTR